MRAATGFSSEERFAEELGVVQQQVIVEHSVVQPRPTAPRALSVHDVSLWHAGLAQRPIVAERSIAGKRPIAAEQPIAAERPIAAEQPIAGKQPIAAERPIAAGRQFVRANRRASLQHSFG